MSTQPDRPPVSAGRPLTLRGVRTHNLKNISVEIPRNTLTVITGVSGSGKSSLAFDTIYAEGQRRYVESLSAYARQFLERMDKPDVDFMSGISPAIAIQQKNTTTNPRSTVGTTTELYDYLRLLYARIGKTYSPVSGEIVRKDTPAGIISELMARYPEGTRFYVCFAPRRHESRSAAEEIALLREKGLNRVLRADESIADLSAEPDAAVDLATDRVLVDRLVTAPDEAFKTRLAGSLETALRESGGTVILRIKDGPELPFSDKFERDGMTFSEPAPQMFSFNNPYGACPQCEGFGRVAGIDEDLVIPDREKSIRGGCIQPFQSPKYSHQQKLLIKVAARHQLPIDLPYAMLDKKMRDIIWNGREEYPGINAFFEEIRQEFYKVHMRVFYSRYRGYTRCSRCDGYRIREDALYVKIADHHIGQISEMTIGHARTFFDQLELSTFDSQVAGQILYEIRKRLRYLDDVGLDYITLDRPTSTLSGGEAQRINLANALGSSLIGSLYVLDEPTIGLHPRDNDRLISILKSLRDIGNTVLVVEHDPEMIRAADYVLDIGPFAGRFGGEVVFAGPVPELLASQTLTGKFLSGRKAIPVPERRRKGNGKSLVVDGAFENNLKNITVEFPLGMMVVVTGVSGSGKSTLVHDTLCAGLQKELGLMTERVGRHREIRGAGHVQQIEVVDQSPIGRSSRSNPVTYIKAFDEIREVFATTRQSRIMGFTAGHFSFNVPGGRCETCQGEGVQVIEMQFLADLELPCEVCNGKRFKKEVLGVTYRGKSIYDVLEMSVAEAIDFFVDEASVINRLRVLDEVGLGYLKLGQSATTLSGGEAQRVKLARFLARENAEHTLYFFDEPTTGLHFEDTARLMTCFNRLVEQGHSVIIIEHNLDVIKCADWVIDIGPEGGFRGGTLVAAGTPEEISAIESSHTGRFLKAELARRPA